MDNSACENYNSIIGNEISSFTSSIWSCQFDNYSVLSGISSQLDLLHGNVSLPSGGETVLDILDINEASMRGNNASSSYQLCSLPPCLADQNFTASSEDLQVINSDCRSIPEKRKRKWLLPEKSCSLLLDSSSLTAEGGFQISFGDPEKSKKGRFEKEYEPDVEGIAQLKEMIYRAAALRPVSSRTEAAVEKPKRKNVRISTDPQTAAARQRRERISERLRVLQRLVPGGSKMDTASMLDEAANYLKFLKTQVRSLERMGRTASPMQTIFQLPS